MFWLLSAAVLTLLSARSWWSASAGGISSRTSASSYAGSAPWEPPTGWRTLRRGWSRCVWAWWIGDVLTVRRGPVLHRRVRLVAHVAADVGPLALKPFGSHGVAVRLALPGDCWIEVAADEWSRVQLVGPYLAAAVTHLPKAPTPRGHHRPRNGP